MLIIRSTLVLTFALLSLFSTSQGAAIPPSPQDQSLLPDDSAGLDSRSYSSKERGAKPLGRCWVVRKSALLGNPADLGGDVHLYNLNAPIKKGARGEGLVESAIIVSTHLEGTPRVELYGLDLDIKIGCDSPGSFLSWAVVPESELTTPCEGRDMTEEDAEKSRNVLRQARLAIPGTKWRARLSKVVNYGSALENKQNEVQAMLLRNTNPNNGQVSVGLLTERPLRGLNSIPFSKDRNVAMGTIETTELTPDFSDPRNEMKLEEIESWTINLYRASGRMELGRSWVGQPMNVLGAFSPSKNYVRMTIIDMTEFVSGLVRVVILDSDFETPAGRSSAPVANFPSEDGKPSQAWSGLIKMLQLLPDGSPSDISSQGLGQLRASFIELEWLGTAWELKGSETCVIVLMPPTTANVEIGKLPGKCGAVREQSTATTSPSKFSLPADGYNHYLDGEMIEWGTISICQLGRRMEHLDMIPKNTLRLRQDLFKLARDNRGLGVSD